MLLAYVKRYASQYLEEEIDRAVISVPAYFDDIQRQAVVEAGKKAGFTVERIINDPTAAALSYGIGHLENESHILIYDLGGGTFDVTLLELFDGVLEVKASNGDNSLGGKDFDEALIHWLFSRFEDKYQLSLKGNVYAMARLKEHAEQCKIALSTHEEETIQIPLLAEKDGLPLALEETVTRSQFEDLIRNLLNKTHDPIQVALDDGKVDKEDLDMILSVGGSTRIPLVSHDDSKGEKERIDVSGWKSSPFSGNYRSILRRNEKLLKNLEDHDESEELARELKELIYQLKKAVIEEDLEQADELEEDIRDLLDET